MWSCKFGLRSRSSLIQQPLLEHEHIVLPRVFLAPSMALTRYSDECCHISTSAGLSHSNPRYSEQASLSRQCILPTSSAAGRRRSSLDPAHLSSHLSISRAACYCLLCAIVLQSQFGCSLILQDQALKSLGKSVRCSVPCSLVQSFPHIAPP